MARPFDIAMLYLWQYTIYYSNLVVDLDNKVLQRVMSVTQKCAVTLQAFTQDGSDAWDLMDEDQHNPPQILRNAIYLLHIKVRTDIKPMLVKPGSHLNHVQPVSVKNERALAPFVQYKVLLPMNIQHGDPRKACFTS